MSKYGALTSPTRSWRGSPPPDNVTVFPLEAAIIWKTVFCFCQSRKFAAEITFRVPPGGFSQS